MDIRSVERAVSEAWGRDIRIVRALAGGMNGTTLEAETAEGRCVVKWVPAGLRADLVRGAAAAETVAAAGIVSGAPIPALSGALTVEAVGGEAMVMQFVEGDELADGREDQEAMASLLVRIHIATSTPPDAAFHYATWLRSSLEEPHPSWVHRAVDDVLSEHDRLPEVRWSMLNGDPSPDEFRRAGNRIALLDWGAAARGPALYDVATLCMYLGGPGRAAAFLQAYQDADPRSAREIHHLDAFLRFRGAIQAVYFSRRIAEDDAPSPSDENRRGLSDARGLLVEWGLASPS